MWPSFSLWACRILKMRSCLRRPLAPGRSRVRAILVSSVILFSLSSAIVICHLREFFCLRKDCCESEARTSFLRKPEGPPDGPAWRDFQESLLCSATLGFCNLRMGQFDYGIRLGCLAHADKHVIHRFLHTSIRLVKLPRCLGNQLTQKITVPHSVECVINQVRAHDCSFLLI